jgi:hypothetical protein
MEYTTIPVMMRPNGTIEAMIRFYNHLSMDREKLKELVEVFNNLNPDAKPPRPYQQVLMPVLVEYAENEK